MILKIKSSLGWQYQAGVVRCTAEFPVAESTRGEDADPQRGCRLFNGLVELRDYVDKTWGPKRDAAHEFWPEMSEACEYVIRHFIGWLADGGYVHAFLNDEAYLLSDNGDTIERL